MTDHVSVARPTSFNCASTSVVGGRGILSPKSEREDQGSRFLGEVGILHYWFRNVYMYICIYVYMYTCKCIHIRYVYNIYIYIYIDI